MAERALSKIQFGLESSAAHGTPVAADTLLLGAEIGAVPVDRVPVFPEDALGVRARSSRSVVHNFLVQNTLRIEHGYFDILPMIMSGGVAGDITAVEETGSEGDYKWDHTPSMTATNSPDSITLEVGDDSDAYEIEYVMFEKLKFSGVVAQGAEASPVTIEADYFGRQVTKTAFTGAIAAAAVEPMNAKLSRLYIDSTWAGRATTEKTSLLRAWDLEIITGLHPKFFGSANQHFDAHGESFIDVMLTLTLEGGDLADDEFDDFKDGVAHAVSIELEGSQIGSGVNFKFSASVWGAYENVIPLGEEDRGNNIHTAVFHGMYDITGAQILELYSIVDTNAF